jgi:hypothetical protein
MKNKTLDKKELKDFLKLYNRYIVSLVNQDNFSSEVVTDEELDFLINLFEDMKFHKAVFNKQLTIIK